MLIKLGLDAAAYYLCSQKLYASIFSMCSLSIVLADLVMTFSLAVVWFLGADKTPVPLCFLLANASATYGALPLPLIFMGLLDYYLHSNYLCNQSTFFKYLKNTALTLLAWTLALMHSFKYVKAKLIELDYGWIKALVCEVEESTVIIYFIWVLFVSIICAMLPFLPSFPQWLKEADRLSEEREEQENHNSDLFLSTKCTKSKLSLEHQEKKISGRPPLWLSLTLSFGSFWMPYLTISATCQFFGLGVPAYVTVNVLWVECTNSLLTGFMFWAKSNKQGPYCQLPNNVCLWHVFWHLSKGNVQQTLAITVFNPSKAKRNTLFYV